MGNESNQLSGWWNRVGAVCLDGLILLVPLVVLALIFGDYHIVHGYSYSNGQEFRATQLHAHFNWAGYIFAGAYSVLLFMRKVHNGQTLGKQGASIRVVKNDGTPMDWATALGREVGCKLLPGAVAALIGGPLVLVFLLWFLLDYLWPLWDSENRALHDHIMKTHVVKVPPLTGVPPQWTGPINLPPGQ